MALWPTPCRVDDGDVMSKRRVSLAGSTAISGSLESSRVVHFHVCISLDFSSDGCERAGAVYREQRSLAGQMGSPSAGFQYERSSELQSAFLFGRPQLRFSVYWPASLCEDFTLCFSPSRQFALCEENPSREADSRSDSQHFTFYIARAGPVLNQLNPVSISHVPVISEDYSF
jgi:hypothetical protein